MMLMKCYGWWWRRLLFTPFIIPNAAASAGESLGPSRPLGASTWTGPVTSTSTRRSSRGLWETPWVGASEKNVSSQLRSKDTLQKLFKSWEKRQKFFNKNMAQGPLPKCYLFHVRSSQSTVKPSSRRKCFWERRPDRFLTMPRKSLQTPVDLSEGISNRHVSKKMMFV